MDPFEGEKARCLQILNSTGTMALQFQNVLASLRSDGGTSCIPQGRTDGGTLHAKALYTLGTRRFGLLPKASSQLLRGPPGAPRYRGRTCASPRRWCRTTSCRERTQAGSTSSTTLVWMARRRTSCCRLGRGSMAPLRSLVSPHDARMLDPRRSGTTKIRSPVRPSVPSCVPATVAWLRPGLSSQLLGLGLKPQLLGLGLRPQLLGVQKDKQGARAQMQVDRLHHHARPARVGTEGCALASCYKLAA